MCGYREKKPSSMAERILIAETVVLGLIVLGVLGRELPGAIREVRMWRMASLRKPSAREAGAQRGRTR
jgi:hypothetical protein